MTYATVQYPFIVGTYKYLFYEYNRHDVPSDITFRFKDSDHTIKAHGFLLETVSSTFRTMFSENVNETSFTINDTHPDIFEMVLRACYLKEVKLKTVEEAAELYEAAEIYDIPDLKERCWIYLLNNVHWHNAIYVYDKAFLLNLDPVIKRCREYFEKYDYQPLISHLFRKEEISEDAFIAVAEAWKGEHCELYQILEVFVMLGKLKSYSHAIGTISFLAMSIEDVLSAKLLTDEEKCAVIANLQSEEARFKSFIPMPENLSSELFVYHKNAEARDFAHLIWTGLLIASSTDKEYFEHVLQKCVIIGGGFVDEGVYEKAFERVRKGERMQKSDFEYLFVELKRYIDVFAKYRIDYDFGRRMTIVDKDREEFGMWGYDPLPQYELISYKLK